jgi:hypothetical protein
VSQNQGTRIWLPQHVSRLMAYDPPIANPSEAVIYITASPMITHERPNFKAIVIRILYKQNSLGKLQKEKKSKSLWGLAWCMAGVKSPGPSMERRRDTLQEDLGSLCCVFPVAQAPVRAGAFLLENQDIRIQDPIPAS